MRRAKAPALLLPILLLAAISGISQEPPPHDIPPDNVQGNWTIYSKNINTGQTVRKFAHINQNGHHLMGHFRGPYQEGPITGFVNGHQIAFDTVTRTVLHFRGRIDGNRISGLYGIHGRHAEWYAIRVD